MEARFLALDPQECLTLFVDRHALRVLASCSADSDINRRGNDSSSRTRMRQHRLAGLLQSRNSLFARHSRKVVEKLG